DQSARACQNAASAHLDLEQRCSLHDPRFGRSPGLGRTDGIEVANNQLVWFHVRGPDWKGIDTEQQGSNSKRYPESDKPQPRRLHLQPFLADAMWWAPPGDSASPPPASDKKACERKPAGAIQS